MRTFIAEVSPDTRWINIGKITASSTALSAMLRDYATAEAVTGVLPWQFAQGGGAVPKAVLLRFRTDSNENDTNVVDLLASRGPDHYVRIATLTLTQGQQKHSGTIYFVDTLVATNEETLLDGEEGLSGANYIAHYYVRTLGLDRLLFQATTLNSTSVYIDLCNIYE